MLGVMGETRYVMGCISQLEDGRYFLEDLSASLPVDLSSAQLAHGYITGMTQHINLVLPAGRLVGSTLYVACLRMSRPCSRC